MKTVRFTQVVEKSGQPEVYLLFTKPEDDSTFQQALKAKRIMTVHGDAKTDHGSVGYEAGARSQVLIFPKSLKTFEGKNVVGIKYELLNEKLEPKSKVMTLKKEVSHESRVEKVEKKSFKPATHRSEKVEKGKVLEFPKVAEDEDESDNDSEIKAKVRRAIKALEGGKQVAAFNILKSIVET